jgi:hypothetical protein
MTLTKRSRDLDPARVEHLRARVVRCDSARVTPYLRNLSIQMEIVWLVLEHPIETVGIWLLKVWYGGEISK